LQDVSAALRTSRMELLEREGRAEEEGAVAKKQHKALMENLTAMQAERDTLAELNSKLEKQKERPIGVDASGRSLFQVRNYCSPLPYQPSPLG